MPNEIGFEEACRERVICVNCIYCIQNYLHIEIGLFCS